MSCHLHDQPPDKKPSSEASRVAGQDKGICAIIMTVTGTGFNDIFGSHFSTRSTELHLSSTSDHKEDPVDGSIFFGESGDICI